MNFYCTYESTFMLISCLFVVHRLFFMFSFIWLSYFCVCEEKIQRNWKWRMEWFVCVYTLDDQVSEKVDLDDAYTSAEALLHDGVRRRCICHRCIVAHGVCPLSVRARIRFFASFVLDSKRVWCNFMYEFPERRDVKCEPVWLQRHTKVHFEWVRIHSSLS